MAGASALWRLTTPCPLKQEELEYASSNRRARAALSQLPACRQARLLTWDVTVTDGRRMRGRLFEPSVAAARRVVVYAPSELEGGGGAAECLQLVCQLLPLGVAVFALDVTPTGTTHCCAQDVAAAVQLLRCGRGSLPPYPCIALWGRSVGAAAVLRFAAQDVDVACLVCDSAYADLGSLLAMPGWASVPLFGFCQLASLVSGQATQKEALVEVQPEECARHCLVPALFLHGSDDSSVPAEHARKLRAAYGGEAQIFSMADCDHDTPRPPEFLTKAALFLARVFSLESDAIRELELVLSSSFSVPCRKQAAQDNPDLTKRVAALLRSEDKESRRLGLAMKVASACPLYEKSRFLRLTEKGQMPSRSQSQTGSIKRYCIGLTLPSAESEACIAWAAERRQCPEKGAISGTVHFLAVSCCRIRLMRATVCLPLQQEGCGSRPRASEKVLRDLSAQTLQLEPKQAPYSASLMIADTGRVEFIINSRVGMCYEPRKMAEPPLGIGCGGLSMWAVTFGDAASAVAILDCSTEGCDASSGERSFAQQGQMMEDLPISAAQEAMQRREPRKQRLIPSLELPLRLPIHSRHDDPPMLSSLAVWRPDPSQQNLPATPGNCSSSRGGSSRGGSSAWPTLLTDGSKGTFLSKATDSLACSSLESENDDKSYEIDHGECHVNRGIQRQEAGSISPGSTSEDGGQARTWPDLQECAFCSGHDARRHTWAGEALLAFGQ